MSRPPPPRVLRRRPIRAAGAAVAGLPRGATLGLALALLAPTGCDDHVIGHGAPFGTNCMRDPPLDWENFGDALIGWQCRSCHSVTARENLRQDAPITVNLDTYDDVLLWADAIQAVAVDSDAMPPSSAMRPEEREQLAEWMRCDVFPARGQVVAEPEEGG